MDSVKITGHCINLFDRNIKMQNFASAWEKIINIKRIEAFDGRPNNGALGCYKSHLNVLKDYDHGNSHVLILEDDAVPCLDFNYRLQLFTKQLPLNWNIFMLGHWPMINYKSTQITKNIHKAHKGVLATHCYLVNNAFIPKLIDVYNNASNKNLDYIFNVLQDRYNVYMAIPSFSYQCGNWSDTGNNATDYSGTKTFFKETL